MKLQSITLDNFGAFVGTHTLPLTAEKDKPIVLIGALNGSGKTTLLDAIKLSLYGKMADCSTRGRLGYEKFLANCINRSIVGPARAGVSISFEVITSEGRSSIRVSRSWQRNNHGDVTENLDVFRNGRLDPLLSKNWYEHVDEFMPLAIANLFLFDGEKIEYFANPKHSAELIRTGIEALLGIGLLSQLRDDLRSVVSRRLQKSEDAKVGNERSEKILQLTLSNAESARELRLLREETEDLEVEVRRDKEEFDRLAYEYKRYGGDLFDNREGLKQEKIELEKLLLMENTKLQTLIAGALPFTHVLNDLKQLKLVAEESENFFEASQRAEVIEGTLQEFKRFVSGKSKKINLEELSKLSDEFAGGRREVKEPEILSGANPSKINETIQATINSASELRSHTMKLDALNAELERIEASISAVPEQEDLEKTASALHETETKIREKSKLLEELQTTADKKEKDLNDSRTRLDQLLKEDQIHYFANETDARVIKQSERVRDTLNKLRKSLAETSVKKLNVLIRESLQSLLRKKAMISRVDVDPNSFELTLFDDKGSKIDVTRMSAGERQLVAVSIVWALTKASGRALPTIIDTPLGRLDNQHRDLLIDGYFPYAGRQVLLLSTDSEIFGERYARLKQYCNKEYAINFNESDGTSEFIPNYPFRTHEVSA